MRSTAPGFAKPSVVADKLPRKWVFSRALSAMAAALPCTATDWRLSDVASEAIMEWAKSPRARGQAWTVEAHPVAQENDAERAVQAALAIQRALSELNGKNAGTGKLVLAARIPQRAGGDGERAKYSATCQTSRPGRRRWPSRARCGHGAGARQMRLVSPSSAAATNSMACPNR